MCSVDGAEELMAVAEQNIDDSTECRKCKSRPVRVMLRKTDPYCKDCFNSYATHKFRSSLGKHKAVPAPATSVAVALGSSPSSFALLHLVHEAVTHTDPCKRLWINPVFFHIDMSSSGSSPRDSTSIVEAVHRLGHQCHTTPLHHAMAAHLPVTALICPSSSISLNQNEISNTSKESGTADGTALAAAIRAAAIKESNKSKNLETQIKHNASNAKNASKIATAAAETSRDEGTNETHDDSVTVAALQNELKQMLWNCPNDTEREYTKRCLVYRCIEQCTRQLGCQFALLGNSATNIAANLLASMALGAGARVHRETNFSHESASGMKMYKPLLELQEQELLHYLNLNDMPYNRAEQQSATGSVQDCSKSFVCGLQANFPSTVPTVARMAAKLTPYNAKTASLTLSNRAILPAAIDSSKCEDATDSNPSNPETWSLMKETFTNMLRAGANNDRSCNESNNESDQRWHDAVDTILKGIMKDWETEQCYNNSNYSAARSISLHADASEHREDQCRLCHSAIDTQQPRSSAVYAARHSLALSSRCVPGDADFDAWFTARCQRFVGAYNATARSQTQLHQTQSFFDLANQVTFDHLKDYLCYACQVTVLKMRSLDSLPRPLLEVGLQNVKQEVQEISWLITHLPDSSPSASSA